MGILYPNRCALCDQVLPVGEKEICRICKKKNLLIREPKCRKCGKPLLEEEEYCEECLEKDFSYECGNAVFNYDRLLQQSITRFKYKGRKEYAAFYGRVMYEEYGVWLHQTGVQYIIPVPIHPNRRRKRGYNQAELVAKVLSQYSQIPYLKNFLIRCKDTLPQKELTSREREKNLQDAFQVQYGKASGIYQAPDTVVLLDDIYTTGSTIENCTRQLKRAGVDQVFFISVSIVQL